MQEISNGKGALVVEEHFDPVVDAFRSMVAALAAINGHDVADAVAKHKRWSIEQKAHTWCNGKGGLINTKLGACCYEEKHERDVDSAGGDAGNPCGMDHCR